jgi:hypothetical protein
MEVVGLLLADSMLSTHTTFLLLAEFHDEWIDQLVEAGLSCRIMLIALHGNVEMHVSVTNVTMTITMDFLLFFSCEQAGLSYVLSSGFDNAIVVVSVERDIVFKGLNKIIQKR